MKPMNSNKNTLKRVSSLPKHTLNLKLTSNKQSLALWVCLGSTYYTETEFFFY